MLKNKMYFESNFCSNPICYSEKNQKVAQVNLTVNQIISHTHDVSTGEFMDSKRAKSITIRVIAVKANYYTRRQAEVINFAPVNCLKEARFT